MSATADVQGISEFFATPPGPAKDPTDGTVAVAVQPSDMVGICHVEGRQFTVKTHYLDKPAEPLSDAAMSRIFHIHIKEALPGDILVFMTGQESIQGLQKMVEDTAERLPNDVPKMLVLPLYAALPQEAQQRVFNPAPRFTRKVILATNIAETSVTVPGVRFVIDGGKSKVKRFHNTLGFESLVGKAISKSSADQRKGRAGREAPGQCYRLYTEKSYNELEPQMSPEIQRSNLSSAVLAIKARDLDTSSGGMDDIRFFPFLTPPSDDALERACLQLHWIGALDAKTGKITPLGRQIARMPLPPQLGRVVLEAAKPERDCLRDVIDIVACLSVESIFLPAETEDAREKAAEARSQLFRRSGDHMTLLATKAALERFSAIMIARSDGKPGDRPRSSEKSEDFHSNVKGILKCMLRGRAKHR
ncbi:P-loop containing nucleoside triphosphate hydrolase protein [Dissoconium aciculare CBS 342.82]|uniref:RNA helicase n=1 Tax=Dissoconium aciculare CBS 342.82 TaxID=1314786 RepID=A0A6J3MA87_9PEZI|nr:P-loop containing nucleoside triphosphate hydrolase protein [Dissoconium aciculare CBS 342.82]KAF1824941.1 P-loop containing nucleoside triphosphate hydrolase protein [Dissoconium aciculare CBS 342.82]